MSILQTVLVFIGIPLGIVLLIFLATYGKSLFQQPNRYRPGRPWNYPPTWYVPHPDAVVQARATTSGEPHSTTAVGGASGEW